jgi:drug/metabolite transporter (DMT)-like permease
MQIAVFLFLCILWGTTWIAIKISLEGFPPFTGASIRFAMALCILFPYVRWNKVSLRINKNQIAPLSLSALLMYVFDYGLIYWGEQHLSAGVTAIFFATFALFTALWANFVFRNERFRSNKLVGLLLGFAGIVMVFYDQLIITHFSSGVIAGSTAVVLGAAGGALSVVIVKKYLTGISSTALAFNQMLIGLGFLAAIALLFESRPTAIAPLKIWLAILYLGGVGSALAFGLYYWLLQQMSAITLSLIIYITPVIALIADFLYYGTVIHYRSVIGMVVIFLGIALTQSDAWYYLVWKRAR